MAPSPQHLVPDGAPWKDWPDLESPRLRLERLAPGHADGFFELWSDADVARYSGQVTDLAGGNIPTPVVCRADSDRILEFFLPHHCADERARWAAIEPDENAFLGALGFNHWHPRLELAFHLHPRHWGQGYMREAAMLLIERIDRECPQEIEAFAEPSNERSIGLLLRLGFALDGDTQGSPRSATRFVRPPQPPSHE